MTTTERDISVAIAHDQITTLGGAERVAFELARTFDASIYAGWVDQSLVPDGVTVNELFGSRMGQFAYNRHYLVTDLYQMQAWQRRPELAAYDTVILNKTNPCWYVPPDTQTVIQYIHSTPRNFYDRFQDLKKGPIKRYLMAAMRSLYLPNVQYPDLRVCNSELVARRLSRYWGLTADAVVYPPVPTEEFSPDVAPTRDYYLTVGRLARNKHTVDIVDAANETGVPLTVAGDGHRRDAVESAAGPTVDVLGYVSEERKRKLLAGAKAFIFAAANEDFGMTPIEAMAAGTPVIGVREGMTQHQIIDGRNGLVFDRGELIPEIQRFEQAGVQWSEERISEWAKAVCSRERFRTAMRDLVSEAEQASRVEPQWQTEPEVLADGRH